LFHERFQFAGIEPQALAVVTEINLDILEVQDKKRNIAFWANASHGSASRRDDGVGAVEASSTSRVLPSLGFWTFI
jgi:hypothetical protein